MIFILIWGLAGVNLFMNFSQFSLTSVPKQTLDWICLGLFNHFSVYFTVCST